MCAKKREADGREHNEHPINYYFVCMIIIFDSFLINMIHLVLQNVISISPMKLSTKQIYLEINQYDKHLSTKAFSFNKNES